MLNAVNARHEKVAMDLGNKTGFFRQTVTQRVLWLSLGLLGGCGHAARKEMPPPLPISVQPAVDIGIPACNAYLNSYLACHRAAHIFPADTLQSHYQAMLSDLQQSAADPQVRPYLAARCVGLRQQLDITLQGRSCEAPAAAGTTPQVSKPTSASPTSTQN
jgi:hypothetical protein